MSWAEVKKINSDMTKPLDELIIEKTNVKIQTITFSFSSSVVAPNTITQTISQVDTSKSIIVPISYINEPYVSSLSYAFTSSTEIKATRTITEGYSVTNFNATVLVITFGGDVS